MVKQTKSICLGMMRSLKRESKSIKIVMWWANTAFCRNGPLMSLFMPLLCPYSLLFQKIYKTCAFNNQNQLNLVYLYSISNVFFIYILLPHRTDKFQIRSGNMGDLLRISLRNDDTGESADWHLDKILIVDSSGKEYRFPANVWLSHDPGRQLDIMLTKGMFLLYQ